MLFRSACEGEGEGEAAGTLAYWCQAHRDYFTRNCTEFGLVFNEDMLVVCERFEVLHFLD